MKKSQLKNIIRESIKELMNEQDFLPLVYPPTTVDQGNDIAHVVIRDCSSELPVYSQPACLNNHSQYEIGHQFKFYDVFNNIRTGYLESIVTQGKCPPATLNNGLYLFNPIEDPYVGKCEGNPNSTFVPAEPETIYYSFNDFPNEKEAQSQANAGNTLIFRFDFCPALSTDQSMINSPALDASGCITLENPLTPFNYGQYSLGVMNPQPGMFNYGDGSCQTACAAANDDSDTKPNPDDFSGGPGGGPSGGPADQKDPVGTTPFFTTNPNIPSAPKKTNQPSRGDIQKGRMQKLANIKPRRR